MKGLITLHEGNSITRTPLTPTNCPQLAFTLNLKQTTHTIYSNQMKPQKKIIYIDKPYRLLRSCASKRKKSSSSPSTHS